MGKGFSMFTSHLEKEACLWLAPNWLLSSFQGSPSFDLQDRAWWTRSFNLSLHLVDFRWWPLPADARGLILACPHCLIWGTATSDLCSMIGNILMGFSSPPAKAGSPSPQGPCRGQGDSKSPLVARSPSAEGGRGALQNWGQRVNLEGLCPGHRDSWVRQPQVWS